MSTNSTTAPPRKNDPRRIAAQRIITAVLSGLDPLRVEKPMRMSDWSRKNFYLVRESSQTEGGWKPWPYQIAVMDAISDDDLIEIDIKKSARWGYTKILVCGLLYFAEHKKRNQAIWQPTESDKDEFVKVELESAIRDIPCIKRIFPSAFQKNKKNTLKLKQFITGVIHTKGGTSAGEYRRITIATGWFDEIAGFPLDVDGEGRPFNLAKKRTEGAIFPKMVVGSTPKLKGSCQIDERIQQAQEVFAYYIPCPHCGHEHELEWGGLGVEKDQSKGLVWFDDDPKTAAYICPACHAIYRQPEYLEGAEKGRWINPDTGTWIDINPDGPLLFRDGDGETKAKPTHIAFRGWAIYSPQKSWESIIEEYIVARRKAAVGDNSLLKTFTNITLGECWEDEVEKGDAQALISRAEPYPLCVAPTGVLILVAFVDVQVDRFELVVWGIGRGEEMWVVDYRVIDGINPFLDEDWLILDQHLERRYSHARGGTLGIEITGIDTGYATHQAYRYCRSRERQKIYATKGETVEGKPIKSRRSFVEVRQKSGRPIRKGCKLHFIGTDTAKDTLWGRLQNERPGPGYLHFSNQLPPQFFNQLVSENRVVRISGGQQIYKWEKPTNSTRNEVLDCTVGALWGLEMLIERYRNVDLFWNEMESRLVKVSSFDIIDKPMAEQLIEEQPKSLITPKVAANGIRLTGWARG